MMVVCMCKKGDKKKVATQMKVTPTLYGSEAEEVLKKISSKPSNELIQKKIDNLEKKFEGMYRRRG